MAFPDQYWKRFNEVASAIGARRPEDLILVITAETAGTFDPRRTRYSRHPDSRPKSWSDVITWEQDHGSASGALGLNTIMRPAAQAMGLSADEWWNIADIPAGDPHALDYTEKFFKSIRAWRGLDRPFIDAVELYLANAAPGLLGQKLSPSTVVYSGQAAASNPALMDPDGYVRVSGLQKALMQIATIDPKMGISAKPFLEEYNSYVARTGDVYLGPKMVATEAPNVRQVKYGPNQPYTPFDPDGIEQINQANQSTPLHPNLVFARKITSAMDIPVSRDAVGVTVVLAILVFAFRKVVQRF